MFQGQVPCVFQLADPSCPATAKWLAWFVHEENTARCGWNEPWPVCDEHKRLIHGSSHPFWRTWYQSQAVGCPACPACGTPLRLEKFEPI